MLLANFSKVHKDFGGNPILQNVDVELLEGERIGLIGENGSGKSTFFKLLAGLETPSQGMISRRRNLTIGYLEQEVDPLMYTKAMFEFVAEVSAELSTLPRLLGQLEAQMADPEVTAHPEALEGILAAYSEAQARYEALGGYTLEHKVAAILYGLGFSSDEFACKIGTLSGGEKKLVNLARILLEMPDLLLLDEPDNHLDMQAKAWLETYIQTYPGTVLIISHDRHLLDRAVKKIFVLEDGEISVYAGNYSYYTQERQRHLLKLQEQYSLQQGEIKRLQESMYRLKSWAKINDKHARRAEYMAKRVEQAKQEAINKPFLVRDTMLVDLDAG